MALKDDAKAGSRTSSRSKHPLRAVDELKSAVWPGIPGMNEALGWLKKAPAGSEWHDATGMAEALWLAGIQAGHRQGATMAEVNPGVQRSPAPGLDAVSNYFGAMRHAAELGTTPLHVAVLFGRRDAAEMLLSQGADVSAPGKLGWCPLHVAAGEGHQDVVSLLIDRGADANARNDEDASPLLIAVVQGHAAVVRVLLARGADPDQPAGPFATMPLHHAAQSGRTDVVEALLDGGADVNIEDGAGITAINWAARGLHEAVIKLLLSRGARPNTAGPDGWTPLHWAALHRRTGLAKVLLAAGSKTDAANIEDQTAIDVAQQNADRKMVELLRSAR